MKLINIVEKYHNIKNYLREINQVRKQFSMRIKGVTAFKQTSNLNMNVFEFSSFEKNPSPKNIKQI